MLDNGKVKITLSNTKESLEGIETVVLYAQAYEKGLLEENGMNFNANYKYPTVTNKSGSLFKYVGIDGAINLRISFHRGSEKTLLNYKLNNVDKKYWLPKKPTVKNGQIKINNEGNLAVDSVNIKKENDKRDNVEFKLYIKNKEIALKDIKKEDLKKLITKNEKSFQVQVSAFNKLTKNGSELSDKMDISLPENFWEEVPEVNLKSGKVDTSISPVDSTVSKGKIYMVDLKGGVKKPVFQEEGTGKEFVLDSLSNLNDSNALQDAIGKEIAESVESRTIKRKNKIKGTYDITYNENNDEYQIKYTDVNNNEYYIKFEDKNISSDALGKKFKSMSRIALKRMGVQAKGNSFSK